MCTADWNQQLAEISGRRLVSDQLQSEILSGASKPCAVASVHTLPLHKTSHGKQKKPQHFDVQPFHWWLPRRSLQREVGAFTCHAASRCGAGSPGAADQKASFSIRGDFISEHVQKLHAGLTAA